MTREQQAREDMTQVMSAAHGSNVIRFPRERGHVSAGAQSLKETPKSLKETLWDRIGEGIGWAMIAALAYSVLRLFL